MPKESVALEYAVWPTAWGPMAAVRGPGGLRRVLLPHYSLDDLRALIAFEHPGSKEDSAALADVIALSQAYFRGERVDFAAVACDLPSEKVLGGRVLRACRGIAYGQTRTYSWLAGAAGSPDAARATAGVLARNPLPLVIPCHRVTYADGRLGGFSAPGGVELKRRMLQLEGAR